MYCKKCGTKQKEGHKFCPKCGTPYIMLENNDLETSSEEKEIKGSSQEEVENPKRNMHVQEQEGQLNNGIHYLSHSEETKYRRFAKVGMWVIIVAIVLTFVRAGFGFSFWWYIFLLLLVCVALYFGGVNMPESDGKIRRFDSEDASMIKIASYVGAAMLLILYMWGPLNSNYSDDSTSSSNDSYSVSSENDYPSWLTANKFVCETESGGKMIIRLNKNGTAHMTLANPTGAPIRGYYNGTAVDMSFDGTFTVRGNNVYLSFSGMSKNIVLEMDAELQRLYGEGGGVFKQSLL